MRRNAVMLLSLALKGSGVESEMCVVKVGWFVMMSFVVIMRPIKQLRHH